jgi:maltose alpha-D-glucosyltransferase/alpha-amylase
MYRVYAHDHQARINLGIRRRLAPLLGRDRRRIELMNALLFSLPGTPVIYYGDEIGMGDNIYLGDRNGVRTPMQWSADRNAGFSRTNPQRLYLPVIVDPEYHYESINVEAQENNPHSLLWWMKRLIALRKRHKAFGRGSITFLSPSNPRVLAFIRKCEDEHILVVANLSRFVQYVELDLHAYKGMVAVELFGRTPFPPIGDLPYLLTLGPHSFYWFALEPPPRPAEGVAGMEARLPALHVRGAWQNVLRGAGKAALERALPDYLRERRWFAGKAQRTKGTTIVDAVEIPMADGVAMMTLIRVDYAQGGSEIYALPLSFAKGNGATRLRADSPHAVVAALEVTEKGKFVAGVLFDALEDGRFAAALLEAIARRRQFKGAFGEVVATPTRSFRELRGPADVPLPACVLKAEQSNSSVVYGDRLILKLYRRVGEGKNPELEIGTFLTEKARFPNIARVAGASEYRPPKGEPMTLGVLQAFVPNEGDAWDYTLGQIRQYFERAVTQVAPEGVLAPSGTLLDLTEQDPPLLLGDMLGAYVETARLLGHRTAEMHLALASSTEDPAFAPEPFTSLYQRSVYQSMRNLTSSVMRLLRNRLADLPGDVSLEARKVLDLEGRLLHAFQSVIGRKILAMRIRCHGDYHLGQVLYTGKDFVIIDFEGEPERPLTERRIKRSPLRDVAGMLRSFDYAVATVLFDPSVIRSEDALRLEPWAGFWREWVSSAFLRAYLHRAEEAAFIPKARAELGVLLNVFMLEKSVYELGYELNNRPDWVKIPVHGILRLLRARA